MNTLITVILSFFQTRSSVRLLFINSFAMLAFSPFFIYSVIFAPPTMFDDAYIFVRYANNFISGFGLALNQGGPSVYGCTSLLYTFVVTAGRYIAPAISPAKTLIISSSSFGFLAIFFIVMTCQMLATNYQLKLLSLLLIPYFFTNSTFIYHCLSGMDTTLAIMMNIIIVFSLVLMARRPSLWVVILSAFCSYLAFLTRPDNIFYVLFFPFLFLIYYNKSDKTTISTYFLCLLGCLLLDTLAKQLFFGGFIPLSFFVKKSGFYTNYLGSFYWQPNHFLLDFLRNTAVFWGIIIFTINRKGIKSLLVFLLPVLMTILYLQTTSQIMGHGFRFYFPSVPFLIFGSIISLNNYYPDILHKSRHQLWRLFVRLIIFLLLFFIVIRLGLPFYNSDPAQEKMGHLRWWNQITQMSALCQKLPPGALFAASEFGFITANNPKIHLLDLSGLNDEHLAHHGFSMNYLLSRQPDLIWLPHHDYVGMRTLIINDPRFLDKYYYFPNVFDYGLAVLKSNSTINQIVQEELKRPTR